MFCIGLPVCCFCEDDDDVINRCAAGTFHASVVKNDPLHVNRLTEEWKNMASFLGDSNLLIRLSGGDVASNELSYHKKYHSETSITAKRQKIIQEGTLLIAC